jgi:hypothetical protein
MNAFIGDTAVVCPEMEFSVHQLIELLPDDDWSETNITWDSVLSWDSAPIFDTLLAQEPDSDSISFYVPNDIVLQWIEAEEPADTSGGDTLEIPNTGLIFNYLGTPEFIRQFFPSEMSDSTLKPQLMLFITTSDSLWLDSTGIDSLGQDTSLTLTCYATDDVFIARDTIQLADNRLYLGRGDAYRSLYWLNMEDLLPVFGININKAEYIIFVDSENPLSTGEFVACQRLKLNNLDWMTDPMQADYTSTLVSSSSILGDSLILDLTSYMKDWVTDPGCNYGFVLKFTSESGSIARLPVYTPEELDPSKRPYLHIIYSTGGE